MPKNKTVTSVKTKQIDLEKTVMAKVKSHKITMRPRWYFVLGSFLMMAGLAGLSIGAVFLTNLTFFLLRKHGPMGEWRLQLILNSFPWWIPVFAAVGIALGIWMLKHYDVSYKRNFWFIIMGFIVSIMVAAFTMDRLGLNDLWSGQEPMRRFYQHIEGQNSTLPKGQGQGRMQNGQGIRFNNK